MMKHLLTTLLSVLPLLLVAADATAYTWTGADPEQPTAWEAPANWQDGQVPGPATQAPVLIPGDCTTYPRITAPLALGSSPLTLAGGARLDLRANLTLKGDLRLISQTPTPVEIRLAGDLEVAGDLVVEGPSPYTTGDGWITLTPGKHRIEAPDGVMLPPIRLAGGATAEVDGKQIWSLGLLIENGAELHLQPKQRLVFGVHHQEWQRDPGAKIVIFAARPWIPVRHSRDLVNHGRITGVEAVPFALRTFQDGKAWTITGKSTPNRDIRLDKPTSPLEIKDGTLYLDSREVRPADELDFDLLDAPDAPATLTELKLEQVPQPEPSVDGLVNIAPRARRLTSSPSIGQDIYRLVDGNEGTVATFRSGVTLPGTVRVDLGNATEVRAVRIRQTNLWTPRYRLAADTTGNGEADTVLAVVNGQPNAWQTVLVPTTRCHGISLQALEIKGGWEQSAPGLGELELYATPEAADALPAPTAATTLDPALPRLAAGEPLTVAWPAVPDRRDTRVLRLITTDLWMFGISGGQDNLPAVPLAEHPPFVKTLDDIQTMGADGTLLFIESKMEAFWPSVNFRSVTNEHFWQARDKAMLPTIDGEAKTPPTEPTLEDLPNQRDLLQELVQAFHDREMEVHVIFLGRFGACYVGPEGADVWRVLFEEVAARGVDGISVTADEAYLGMPHPEGEKRPPDDPVRLAFRERFGPEARLPKDIWQRSVDYKRWVVFSYEQHAQRLKAHGDAIRAINPGCVTFTVIGSHPISCNNRMTYGLAYDVLGQSAGIDFLGTDYQPRETRRFTAANTPSPSAMENFVPRSVREGIVSVLQGARMASYYRYNYIASQKSRDHRVREFAFMEAMMETGLTRSRSVGDVACLVSRASEDWWDNDHGTNWLSSNPEAKRGFWSHRAVNQTLNEGGFAYDTYYLDRPETLDQLSRYAVLLLPFPYAIGDEAVAAIERAHAGGAKVLILQRQGDVGPYGATHESPALSRLIESGRADGSVRFVERDLLAWETDRAFPHEFAAELDQLLGERRQLRLAPPGNAVGSYLFTNEGDGRYLLLVNWQNQAQAVEVGVNLPPASYQLLSLSSDTPHQPHAGTHGGNAIWEAADLARFIVDLEPGEVRLVAIQPAGQEWPELPPQADR